MWTRYLSHCYNIVRCIYVHSRHMPILVVLYNYFTSLWFDLFSFVTNNTLLHRKIKIPPYEIWCIRIQFLGVENENIRMIINMSVYCEQVPSSHDEYLKKKKTMPIWLVQMEKGSLSKQLNIFVVVIFVFFSLSELSTNNRNSLARRTNQRHNL